MEKVERTILHSLTEKGNLRLYSVGLSRIGGNLLIVKVSIAFLWREREIREGRGGQSTKIGFNYNIGSHIVIILGN